MGRHSERCANAQNYVTRGGNLTPKQKEELEIKKKKDSFRKVSLILRKCETLRTPEEVRLLETCSDYVKQISERRERTQLYKERVLEREDAPEELQIKARKLAEAIVRAKHLICYTGAGISTSARIPDYRGSQGIWTLLAQGKQIGQHDLSLAEPTFTHMALYELHRRKMLRFVVSQNCDGLHLRSGLPRQSLSEVHGNMYIEACKACKPNVEYWRLFDTTELTARYNHKTMRRCHACGTPLVDTIVHFGERGTLKWPLNWAGACAQSEKTDCILCLGSSLKVLKKYSWLWAMDRPMKKRPELHIVNLQWTPKDSVAALKIHGRCDDVMRLVMQYLGIEVPKYNREKDPIFAHASLLCPEETHTVSQPMLKPQLEDMDVARDCSNDDVDSIKVEREEAGEAAGESSASVEEIKTESNSVDPGPVDSEMGDCYGSSTTNDLQHRLNRFEMEFQSNGGPKEVANDEIKTEAIETVIKEEDEGKGSQINVEASDGRKNDAVKSETQASGSDLLVDHNSMQFEGAMDETSSASKTESGITSTSSPTMSTSSKPCSPVNVTPALAEGGSVQRLNITPTTTSAEITTQLMNMISFETFLKVEASSNCDNGGAADATTRFFLAEARQQMTNAIKNLYQMKHQFKDSFGIDLSNGKAIEITRFEEYQMKSIIASGILVKRSEDYYKELVKYYRNLESSVPDWYDTKYAYSGLHSIIHPPPPEMNLWGSIVMPIYQMKSDALRPSCAFCFQHYGEFGCQFYEAKPMEFHVKSERNGKVVVCECCDYSESENEDQVDETNEVANEDVSVDDNEGVVEAPDGEEAAALTEKVSRAMGQEGDGSGQSSGAKIQAGWYGKGYRKYRHRRKKS